MNKKHKRAFALLGGTLLASIAMLVPEIASAAIPAGTAKFSLNALTQADLQALTSADMIRIIEIGIWLKVMKGTFILFGSGIAVAGFMKFGSEADKPNPMGFWLALTMGIAIVFAGFYLAPDLMLMVVQNMF